MTLLVTGAAGFVGRAVCEVLSSRGRDYRVVDHAWRGGDELRELLGAGDVDRCIHLGWYADPRDYLTNVAMNRRSLTNSLDLLEWLSLHGCRHVVLVGSGLEYRASAGPHGLGDPIEPSSIYAAAKAALHLLARSPLSGRIPVCWARIFNVTGPHEDPRRILPTVARTVIAGEEIALSSATQTRDFLHVHDVATALVSASDACREGSINVCSGEAVVLRDLLVSLARRLGDERLLAFGAIPRPVDDPDAYVGEPSSLRSLGWTREYDLDATLDNVAAFWAGHSRGHGITQLSSTG